MRISYSNPHTDFPNHSRSELACARHSRDPAQIAVRVALFCGRTCRLRCAATTTWHVAHQRERAKEVKPCNQCGKCCLKYGANDLAASAADIRQWEQFRPDIARYVSAGKIWFDPETRQPLTVCPWLETGGGVQGNGYSCSIYADRPEDCRHYPVSIDEMFADDCEMLEPKDRLDWHSAQRKLDLIMLDSRPPLAGG